MEIDIENFTIEECIPHDRTPTYTTKNLVADFDAHPEMYSITRHHWLIKELNFSDKENPGEAVALLLNDLVQANKLGMAVDLMGRFLQYANTVHEMLEMAITVSSIPELIKSYTLIMRHLIQTAHAKKEVNFEFDARINHHQWRQAGPKRPNMIDMAETIVSGNKKLHALNKKIEAIHNENLSHKHAIDELKKLNASYKEQMSMVDAAFESQNGTVSILQEQLRVKDDELLTKKAINREMTNEMSELKSIISSLQEDLTQSEEEKRKLLENLEKVKNSAPTIVQPIAPEPQKPSLSTEAEFMIKNAAASIKTTPDITGTVFSQVFHRHKLRCDQDCRRKYNKFLPWKLADSVVAELICMRVAFSETEYIQMVSELQKSFKRIIFV